MTSCQLAPDTNYALGLSIFRKSKIYIFCHVSTNVVAINRNKRLISNLINRKISIQITKID